MYIIYIAYKSYAQYKLQLPRRIHQQELQNIEAAVRGQSDGLTAQEIHDALATPPPRRTLQYRLKHMVDRQRLHRAGKGRWARYLPPRTGPKASPDARATLSNEVRRSAVPPRSAAAVRTQRYVSQPSHRRRAATYAPALLDSYRPNATFYLSRKQREGLRNIGSMSGNSQSAEGYAGLAPERLLIDLSWNSSRLEGNSYSLLETELLIAQGVTAESRDLSEAQMILNHKAAIEYLATGSEEIGFNRNTILSLHALLADNLLANPRAAGRLRRTPARIKGSVYTPPAAPQEIEAHFDRLLATASAIDDPFEQSFFVLAHVPHLQPFDDVNKRVARLAANLPLIKAQLAPLCFEGVPREAYDQAVLGVNELRSRQFLAEVFVFAYQHSAGHYAAVRHMLGEPDPFRLKHRAMLRDLIRTVVLSSLDKNQAAAHIESNVRQHLGPAERTRLRDVAERELLSLHPGNCARFRIRPLEFAAWRRNWAKQPANQPANQVVRGA